VWLTVAAPRPACGWREACVGCSVVFRAGSADDFAHPPRPTPCRVCSIRSLQSTLLYSLGFASSNILSHFSGRILSLRAKKREKSNEGKGK